MLAKFLAWLMGIGEDLLLDLEDAGTYIMANGGKVLVDAAETAVTAVETTGGTGPEKAAAAFTQVVAVLEKEGIPVVTGAVQTAIQNAYAQLQVNTTTPSTSAAAEASTPAVSGAPTQPPAAEGAQS